MSQKRKETVLVVDDDAFNRQGVCRYLQIHGYPTLEAGDGATAWQMASVHVPRVAVLDIVIPPDTATRPQTRQSVGIQLAHRLQVAIPRLGIVLFSAYEDRGSQVFDLLNYRHRGLAYILKGSHPTMLLQAIQSVLERKLLIHPEVTNVPSLVARLKSQLTPDELVPIETVLVEIEKFTPRERNVVQLLAASYNTEGIAQQLSVSTKSVENYITQIYRKSGLQDAAAQNPSLRPSVLLAKAWLIWELEQGDDNPALA